MKKLLTLTMAVLTAATFTSSGLAGDGCGSSHGEKKDSDKSEESVQS